MVTVRRNEKRRRHCVPCASAPCRTGKIPGRLLEVNGRRSRFCPTKLYEERHGRCADRDAHRHRPPGPRSARVRYIAGQAVRLLTRVGSQAPVPIETKSKSNAFATVFQRHGGRRWPSIAPPRCTHATTGSSATDDDRSASGPVSQRVWLRRGGSILDANQRRRFWAVRNRSIETERDTDAPGCDPRIDHRRMDLPVSCANDSGAQRTGAPPSAIGRDCTDRDAGDGNCWICHRDRDVATRVRPERRPVENRCAPGAPAQTREELAVGMFAPLLAFANFGLLTATGLWFRHRPEIHKRVMLLAMMSLAAPPVIHLCGYVAGHWPGLHSALVPLSFSGLAVLFTGAVIDRLSSGRIHPISLWGPVLLITETFGLIAFVTASAGWHRLATWLVS
jgi:hypothetical protein